MEMTDSIRTYFDQHRQQAYDLLLELAQIPAPSNHEEKRAEFCRNWLEKQGCKGVYVDSALNVIYPLGCTDDNDLAVYMAHSDVVFPDTDPLPLKVEDGRIICPGIGDDTACAVSLMMTAAYIAQNDLQPRDTGLLLVINSGEEGLGNLKGSRKIMEDFGHRVRQFITFDGYADKIADTTVGSKRYKVEVTTEGGHSYGAFGNRNAIAYLASLINALYAIKVPSRGKTTYNVGTISGGTSVNTIAQNAEMLYEFRSDNREDLAEMETHFMAAVDFYRTKGIGIQVTQVGDRPCMGTIDPQRQQALVQRSAQAVRDNYGIEVTYKPSSTDCNIPMSLGIPSVCLGTVIGAGAHTRTEYVVIDSLLPGLKTAAQMILYHF